MKTTRFSGRVLALMAALIMLIQQVPALASDDEWNAVVSDPIAAEEYAAVRFMADDEEIAVLMVQPGSCLGTLPEAPVRDGFSFVGWVTDEDEPVTEETVVTASLEVYASYQDDANPPLEADYADKRMTVHLEAPGEALPADVKPVFEAVSDEQVRAVVENAFGYPVGQIAAVNISFLDADGNKVQPKMPVKISMELLDMEAERVTIVHIPDQVRMTKRSAPPKAEVLAEDIDSGMICFEADSFSIFAAVQTTLRQTVAASDGTTYEIQVNYDNRAGIPMEGTKLMAEEILPGDDLYEAYFAAAADKIGADPDDIGMAHAFDIRIVAEDDPKLVYEPAGKVDVSIRLMNENLEEYENVGVLHFVGNVNAKAPGIQEMDAAVSGETVGFTTDSFSVYVVAGYTMSTTITAEDGLTYRVAVTFHRDALLPDGAALQVHEITGENAQEYLGRAAEALGTDAFPYGRVFDISIVDAEGREVQPEADVSVTVELLDAENEDKEYAVMHFSGDEEEPEEVQAVSEGNTVQFSASGFSVYAITQLPTSDLSGTYGLLRWNGTAKAKAMMAEAINGNSLAAKELTVMTTADRKNTLYVPNDIDDIITMWTFEQATGGKYYIHDGNDQYLKITGDGVTLVGRSEASEIQVVRGSGARYNNQICLKCNGKTLTYKNIESGFGISGNAGEEWLYLVNEKNTTLDNYFMTYSASKISVSDESLQTGSQVIVYTRFWNEDTKHYDFYAIGGDGTLTPCFESGDSIEWVSGRNNELLWQLVQYEEDGVRTNYYELYNLSDKVFLAPQITGMQITSPDIIGIILNGRRDGEYYTSILAWDDPAYAFAGLKVVYDEVTREYHLETCPRAEAMDFYFAVMENIPVDDVLHPVGTIDHTKAGIVMKIKDFSTEVKPQNCTTSQDQLTVMGEAYFYGYAQNSGLLSTDLQNGYPTATRTNKSLGELFAGATTVNHLFLQSTYNATGYYEFDSQENYAYLDGSNFRVYKEIGTYDDTAKNTLKHGQFFPYNDLTPGLFAVTNGKNLYSATGSALPKSHPRYNEQMYLIQNPNKYFGVEIEATFVQTPNGLDDWGHDIIFEFSGDDDFWLYVDGELVIDLGGIHSALPGSVNFRTGNVRVNGVDYTLRELFERNYRTRNPNASDADVATFLGRYFDEGSTVFKDNTPHTMRIFYMERGAGASNLHMRFNLSTAQKGVAQLSKELDGISDTDSSFAEFPYQILYHKADDSTEYYMTNAVHITDNEGHPIVDQTDDHVFYTETKRPVKYEYSTDIGGVSYNHVFFLKPGETADIIFPEDAVDYKVIECGVDTNVYESVKIKESNQELTGAQGSGYQENRKDYAVDYESTDDRPKVTYVNKVRETRTLTIQKNLYDALGNLQSESEANSSTTYDFRLYFGTEFDTDVNTPADMYQYHVKDPDGNYCKWDETQQTFVKITNDDYPNGTDNFSQLTDNTVDPDTGDIIYGEKAQATFDTSMYGGISKIPAYYTVEIPDLVVGTKFNVLERPWETPDGYAFWKYQLNGVDKPTDNVLNGVTGSIITGEDADVKVCNKKGYGLRVNKIWKDAENMVDRDPTYFAVYRISGTQLVLVDDSVQQMPYTASPDNQTLYWFYPELPDGVSLNDFRVFEVTCDAVLGSNGHVSYSNVVPIRDGYTVKLNGEEKGETDRKPYMYKVTYADPEPIGDNVLLFEVTNEPTRPSLVIKKQDWSGNWLPGAEFSLTDGSGGFSQTYTSDSDGLVAEVYLRENVPYTLTETESPSGYYGLQSPMTISIDENGTVTVTNADSNYYTLVNTTPATLIIKNRPVAFQVIKYDKTGNNQETPLKGVKFDLYRKTDDGSTYVKVDAYSGKTSGANGLVNGIDSQLPPGTYQLREISVPKGYRIPSAQEYVYFTVSPTGVFALAANNAGDAAMQGPEEINNVWTYTLKVYNRRTPLTLQKFVSGNMANITEEFTFTINVYSDQACTKKINNPNPNQGGWENSVTRTGSVPAIDLGNFPVGAYVKITESVNAQNYDKNEAAVNGGEKEELSNRTFIFQVPPLAEGQDSIPVEFTNTWNITVETGLVMDAAPYVLIISLGLVSAAVWLLLRRRENS